jgi:hypothetical protein
MALLKIETDRETADEASWHTFAEDDGNGAVEFLVAPWVRTTQSDIDKLAKDKKYVESLNIPWGLLPRGTGNKKLETRVVVLAEYLIRDWKGVADKNGNRLECNLVNKVWLMEHDKIQNFVFDRAQKDGSVAVEEDAKNS